MKPNPNELQGFLRRFRSYDTAFGLSTGGRHVREKNDVRSKHAWQDSTGNSTPDLSEALYQALRHLARGFTYNTRTTPSREHLKAHLIRSVSVGIDDVSSAFVIVLSRLAMRGSSFCHLERTFAPVRLMLLCRTAFGLHHLTTNCTKAGSAERRALCNP